MGARYEPVHRERFVVETTAEGERIRIKAPRHIFVMLFLPFWLVLWTLGGIAAMTQLLTNFELFLVVWLCAWALGWCAAAGTLAWMFTGAEIIAVRGRDIEIAHTALGLSRRWLYQGAQIRNLSVAPQPAWPFQFRWQVPFLANQRNGALKFDYGPRTLYVGAGLDEGEARMIVERLGRILPSAAA
ncbi:hypothetical protein [Sphingomonas azotifigens]|uniref:hypothetical protein n=1 Tax=Sphingomonas azotifigens TaxID=330920 RepID=UPI0009FD9208|nr:hypothetical protein [Sphingomonas azotifigens]